VFSADVCCCEFGIEIDCIANNKKERVTKCVRIGERKRNRKGDVIKDEGAGLIRF